MLSQWVKHEGNQVRKGNILAVIETDKGAMDMEAYEEGVLTRILVNEGIGPGRHPIAIIGDAVAGASAAPAPSVPVPDHAERPVGLPLSTPARPAGITWGAGVDLTARP